MFHIKRESQQTVMKMISADRERTNLLKKYEQNALAFLVQRIPSKINSDMLTAIGLMGNVLVFASFVLAKYVDINLLLLSILGFIISWFGDSLDGRLAVYRNRSRKWYGFALDITVDWLGILLIGLGFIVYVDGPVETMGFAFVVLYGWEMITALLRYKITGHYSIDSGAFGPTEVRIVLAMIFILEVIFVGSIQYISIAVTIILFITNIIDTVTLLKSADELDKIERNAKK